MKRCYIGCCICDTSGRGISFLPMRDRCKTGRLEGVTIIFDLDGTIADTARDLVDAANAALMSEGFPPADADAIKAVAGFGTKAMILSGLTSVARDADPAQLQRLADYLVAYYEDNIAEKTRLFPGFAEVASLLRSRGAKLALCTNKREQLTLKLLCALGIEELFDALAGGDTFPFHKPDPRHITELVRMAGGNLDRALMVGDSEADVAAAKAAGIPVIVVSFGYAAAPAEALGADAVINHFNELLGLIDILLPLQQRL